ncbi:rod shape-determining protein MreC [Paraflavisolibacter sp. H34]|uniref:rod shape-determining protein MreC n=1 Tax=Huijunlia imazamoxiresistens TaxID=3127457 RepID=UPI0030158BAB
MRNIFLFIRRFFVFLTFLVLQFIAWWMLVTNNRYHHTAFSGVASEITGRFNKQADKVDDYFHLRDENKRVHRMNDSLLGLLSLNNVSGNTATKMVADTLRVNDSTKKVKRYLWREGKVVYNSVNFDQNYLQVNRGASGGIRDNMAVLNSDGALVGLVVNVSNNFSQVMSLLHTKTRVPASLKHSNVFGTIEWDAEDPRFVSLKGISRDVEVKKGDSVLTSIYSYNFPPGFLIGTVAGIQPDPASGFYILKIRTAVHFNAVQQVFLVENLQLEEQLKLNEDTKRQLDQQKKTNR